MPWKNKKLFFIANPASNSQQVGRYSTYYSTAFDSNFNLAFFIVAGWPMTPTFMVHSFRRMKLYGMVPVFFLICSASKKKEIESKLQYRARNFFEVYKFRITSSL